MKPYPETPSDRPKMVEPFSRPLQKLVILHLDCAEWLRYLLSNRLKTRAYSREDFREIQGNWCTFHRGRGGRAVVCRGAGVRSAEIDHDLVRQGLLPSEDDALIETIKKFEAKTGIKVELSQYAIQDMIPKTVAAMDSGTVPDVAYSDSYDVQAQGKWAFEGKLEDLSDILLPMKGAFAPNTLETALLYNDVAKKKAYYGFPLKQQSMHVQIWGDMLEQAGFKQSDIPTKWEDYWSFWCDKVQPAHPQGHRPAHLRRRPADGRGIHQLVPVVLHLHGRLQRQAGRRRRQASGRRSQGARRPDPRAEGLHRHLCPGLHAALLHHLEGSGQQRRVPQQDHRDDAQLHDLDRGKVARRRQQPGVDPGTARRRQEGV